MTDEKQSLAELSLEYRRNATLQNYFINKCKDDIKRAEKLKDRDAIKKLKADLLVFYEIKRELNDTANKLENYYKTK